MKKYNTINPTGLKGNDVTDRMKKLMNIELIKEGVDRSVVELTKMGPDGKAYAIIRENKNYFIKVAENKEKLTTEDFQYMGGLMNKMNEAYPTYAKAIKRLSLKFISLNEANDVVGVVDTFHDDKLLSETQKAFGGSTGFVQEEDIEEHDDMDVVAEEDVDLTEDEQAIDEMIDPNGKKAKEDKENSGDNLDGDFNKDATASSTNTGKGDRGAGHDTHVKNTKGFKISEAIDKMDDVIASISGENTRLDNILEGLGDDERAVVMEALKKKD